MNSSPKVHSPAPVRPAPAAPAGLDEAQVKALFAALRTLPGSMASLQETYGRVKDRLSASGQAAYQRELARDLSGQALVSLERLPDGDYPLALRGLEEGEVPHSQCLLRCRGGQRWLELAGPVVRCERLVVGPEGGIDAEHLWLCGPDRLHLRLQGHLGVGQGFLVLDLRLTGTRYGAAGELPVDRLLSASGPCVPVPATAAA